MTKSALWSKCISDEKQGARCLSLLEKRFPNLTVSRVGSPDTFRRGLSDVFSNVSVGILSDDGLSVDAIVTYAHEVFRLAHPIKIAPQQELKALTSPHPLRHVITKQVQQRQVKYEAEAETEAAGSDNDDDEEEGVEGESRMQEPVERALHKQSQRSVHPKLPFAIPLTERDAVHLKKTVDAAPTLHPSLENMFVQEYAHSYHPNVMDQGEWNDENDTNELDEELRALQEEADRIPHATATFNDKQFYKIEHKPTIQSLQQQQRQAPISAWMPHGDAEETEEDLLDAPIHNTHLIQPRMHNHRQF